MLDLRGIQSARFRRFYRNIRRHLAETIREGQAAGEFDASVVAEPAAASIIGLIDGLLLQFVAEGTFPRTMRGWRETAKESVKRILRP
jgi:hypothetical protein